MNKPHRTVGFVGLLLTVAMVTAKLCRALMWSWWWVLAPIWILALALAVIVLVLFVATVIANLR